MQIGGLTTGRHGALVVGLVLLVAACSGDDRPPGSDATTSGSPVTVAQIAAGNTEDVPSALDNLTDERFPAALLDPDQLLAGGPPPDGIPSIDEPKFLPTDRVDFLDDDEPVLALQVGDDARAYPVQVLIWHEIVNDTLDGIPVAVTYCPLCNSAVAYDRRLDDRVLSFGTSGMLYNSALVMYDRQTESLWSHFTGQAVIGHLAGKRLDVFAVSTISWGDWRDANPDGLVLSRDTGHDRDYGTNPYPGYDDIDTAPFLFDGDTDGRLAAKERVVGIEIDGDAVAVRLGPLTDKGVSDIDIAGNQLVVWAQPGTASALDDPIVAGGRDVGATGVFRPIVDNQALTFERRGDGFVDHQTNSHWNVLGQATDGPLTGTALEAVPHVDTFWFAWAAFQPDTQIVPLPAAAAAPPRREPARGSSGRDVYNSV